jgi:hypothetical protein
MMHCTVVLQYGSQLQDMQYGTWGKHFPEFDCDRKFATERKEEQVRMNEWLMRMRADVGKELYSTTVVPVPTAENVESRMYYPAGRLGYDHTDITCAIKSSHAAWLLYGRRSVHIHIHIINLKILPPQI